MQLVKEQSRTAQEQSRTAREQSRAAREQSWGTLNIPWVAKWRGLPSPCRSSGAEQVGPGTEQDNFPRKFHASCLCAFRKSQVQKQARYQPPAAQRSVQRLTRRVKSRSFQLEPSRVRSGLSMQCTAVAHGAKRSWRASVEFNSQQPTHKLNASFRKFFAREIILPRKMSIPGIKEFRSTLI